MMLNRLLPIQKLGLKTRLALLVSLLLLTAILILVPRLLWPPGSNLPHTRINPKDGAEMVLVPAGNFLMGSTDVKPSKSILMIINGITALDARLGARIEDRYEKNIALKLALQSENERKDDECPRHKVFLDTYYIYKNDVTVAEYRKFCRETGRKMPPEPEWSWIDSHPIINVCWYDATAYARWAGAALPTEAQWEKAARGTDARIFPWGKRWDVRKCNNGWTGIGETTPEGDYPSGASPYGALDMAGNVYQWCADWYNGQYYAHSPAANPTGPPTGTMRVLRGSSWADGESEMRTANRLGSKPSNKDVFGGFRCVSPSPVPFAHHTRE